MIDRAIVAAFMLCALGGASGCTKEGVQAAGPQDVEHATPATLRGPYVPAATNVTLRMDTPVGTQVSLPGQGFTATVMNPLLAADGATVVVPAGTKLQGTVVKVERGFAPLLVLDFGTVETKWGEARVQAKLEGAQKVTYPGPEAIYRADPAPYYGYFYGPDVVGFAPPGYYGGYDYWDETIEEILVPQGAEIRIELTRPLIPAGSR